MSYVTFEVDGISSAGRLDGEEVVELGGADLRAWLEAGQPEEEGVRRPLSQVRLRAPVPKPDKFVAVGLNYMDHATEQNKTPPDYPMFFTKANTCVIGPGETIQLPPERYHIDVEVELAVIIGKAGANISEESALDHVFGFTIVNDVSDRKAQKTDRQYYRAKSWPTFGPMGPIVKRAQEFDHRKASIRLSLNGEVRQSSNTDQLIFPVARLIALMSTFQELAVGDVLTTGTPGGVGVFSEPKRFLRDGDRVTCEIEGLGVLENVVRGH